MAVLLVLVTLALVVQCLTLAGVVFLWRRSDRNQLRIDEIVRTITINARADSQIRANEDKINSIVEIMMRNARTAAMANRLWSAEEQRIPPAAAEPYFRPIRAELRSYYLQAGCHLTERELFLDTQRRFGASLERDVCGPLGMQLNECIMIAMAVMREHEDGIK